MQTVGYDHTGIYTDRRNATATPRQAYIDELYAHDLDYAAPPPGRVCVEYPAPALAPRPGDDDGYVPLPDNDDDHHRKPNFRRKHWFC